MATRNSRLEDVLAVLRHAGDPLEIATTLAAQEPDASARQALIDAAVSAFGQKPGARTLQSLSRFVRRATMPADRAAAERFLAIGNPAARWLAASIFEAAGDHAAAAATLEAMDDRAWAEERAVRLVALARNLQRAGRTAEAWRPIRDAALAAETPQTLASVGRLMADGERVETAPARAARRIAIVGTGTLQLWTDALKPALYGAGIRADLFVGEFGQYQQEILDPTSALAAYRPDMIAIAVDHRGLDLHDVAADADEAVDAAVAHFRLLWRTCQERFPAAVLQFPIGGAGGGPVRGLSPTPSRGRARRPPPLHPSPSQAARAGG